MIGAAWLSGLAQFDAEVVIGSCREWWESQTRRPVLADIVRLCRENQNDANWRRDRALPAPARISTAVERAADDERRLALKINEMRYARGDAYRAGRLAEWDAEHGAKLEHLRRLFDEARDRACDEPYAEAAE
jgi:hypothetical protein